ncbi:MAG: sigma-54-dependent Fis family transcriptional regulator [Bacteroidia bacterium]|nr:sigma-54-dependent Fis family transcriptional regulator [Bacteroidia bacterium]
MNKSVLIIDDNEQFGLSLAQMIRSDELHVHISRNSSGAFSRLKNEQIDVIILDIRLGDESGIELLIKLTEQYPGIPVIMLTGFASIESAVQSIKLGAYDYIQKPVQYEKLMTLINNAFTMVSLKKENRELHDRLKDLSPRIQSCDPVVAELKRTIDKLTEANLPILLYGENGTGKELFADYIHFQSSRRAKKILKINCAAFPDSLLDNELFGHEKGAFTGASSVYKGVFERADKGILFLDEIGDMPLEVQAKVLRVLQNKELFRLGGKELIRVDVRIISATNKMLEDLISRGLFRKDLYYRLNTATISIPPLRERVLDIPLLADYFLEEYASENGTVLSRISDDVLTLLKDYSWPGNIRELKNVLNYAAAVSKNGHIEIKDLPRQFQNNMRGCSGGEKDGSRTISSDGNKNARDYLGDSERSIILQELKKTNFNKKKVAEILGISRTTLYSKMSKYGIK